MLTDSPDLIATSDQPDSLCPVCLNPTRRLFRKREYWVRACPQCGHQCAEITASLEHVLHVYGDDYFYGSGTGYSDYVSEGAILRARGRRYARVLKRYATPGTLFDVGAAAGFILRGFLDEGWQGKGIEPNARMAEFAQNQLALQVDAGIFELVDERERYDMVTMIQVFAHFQEPRRALEAAVRMLKPGGLLLIETWERDSWTARFFGQEWHVYNPPSVLQWFSRDGLSRFVQQFAFREIAHGRTMRWINGGHAKAILHHLARESWWGRMAARLVDLVPDRFALPYPAEDLFWVLFKKTPSSRDSFL